MNKFFRTVLILLILSFASCKSKQKSLRRSGAKAPKIEHELLKAQSKRGSAKKEKGKDKNKGDQNASAASKKEAKDLMKFVKEWYGTPHKMGGTTKNGVDCSGFIIVAYREVFNKSFKGRRAEDIFDELEIVKWENLQFGDLVFFKVKGRRIDHVGIYVGDGDFAHTSSSKGVMISALNNPYWTKRYFKSGRYP